LFIVLHFWIHYVFLKLFYLYSFRELINETHLECIVIATDYDIYKHLLYFKYFPTEIWQHLRLWWLFVMPTCRLSKLYVRIIILWKTSVGMTSFVDKTAWSYQFSSDFSLFQSYLVNVCNWMLFAQFDCK
jgi:hypothetical protein